MSSYRQLVHTVSDILFVVKEGHEDGVGIALLMQKANLSYVRATRILSELIQVSLIEEIKKGDSKKYRITSLGIEYLGEYERFSNFAKSFGLTV
jgi:predicted transcriptional regulator